MGLRRKSRELALQFLFSHDFQECASAPENLEKDFDMFCQIYDVDEKSLAYSRQLVLGICQHRNEIDSLLATHAHNWRVERMSSVDRNILRIAVFEMRYSEGAPAQVAINEALEIAKRYSIGESVSFINGILDAVHSASPQ